MERRKKRLVLCFDGTWNAVTAADAVTNVVKLANAVTVASADGTGQIVYYNSGVGSGGPIDRFLGGAFGVGLKSNVQRGLAFLALNYDEGDEIYLFGFSRGAYTARALAGVIGAVGIPSDFSRLAGHWGDYNRLAELQPKMRRLKREHASEAALAALQAQIDAIQKDLKDIPRYSEVPIECVGVWDTVGAYGIPGGFGPLGWARRLTSWTRGFRDTTIGPHIKLGLHAMAIDERRRPFEPTFWTVRKPDVAKAQEGDNKQDAKDAPKQEVEQVWFCGAHSNIGGGYDNSGLSDLALVWMIARVREKTGLEFNLNFDADKQDYFAKTVWPCSAATLYRPDSGRLYRILRPAVRSVLPTPPTTRMAIAWAALKVYFGLRVPRARDRINEKVHWSVRERRDWPSTIVEGSGFQRYSPANVNASDEQFTKPTKFERDLIDRIRAAHAAEIKKRCPMTQANQLCQCVPARGAAATAPLRVGAAS